MRFRINRTELWSALLMLVIAVPTIVGSFNYQIGSLMRMGPGYFPLILGVVLAILAILILISPEPVETLAEEAHTEESLSLREQWVTWIIIVVSVLAFVVLGKYGGLIPATFVMCTLVSFADKRNTYKSALLVGLILTVVSVGLFHYGLQLQFPLFTWG